MRKRTGFTLFTLCLTLFFCFGAKSAQAAGIDDTALENYIAKQYSSAGVLGLGVEVVSPERELYCASFGAANDPESDYVLGSLSQSFTACAVLCLEQEGELALSDMVSDYLPEYQAVANVTLQELLCQTSGIAADETLGNLQAKGKRGEYCRANANYNLLGQMIEQITGLSYDEYLSDNILDPLEMYSTYSLRTGENLSANLLPGYRSFFGFPVEDNDTLDPDDDWMQVASGYLISDAKDMGRYLQMYLNGGQDVISSVRINRMFDQGDTFLDENESLLNATFAGNVSYGMGWLKKEINGQMVYYDIGATETYTAMMFLLPEQELGIALLFNSQDVLVGQELMQDLAAGVLAIAMEQTPKSLGQNDYLIRHGIIDGIFFVLLFASCMPVILIGNWTKRRRKKLFTVWSVIEWVVFQAALPTALGWAFFTQVPLDLLQRYVPEVCVVWLLLIAFLYLGALLRIILWVVAAILGPPKEKKKAFANADDPALRVRTEKNPEKFTDTGILHTAQPQEEEPFVTVISEPVRSAGSEEPAEQEPEEKEPAEQEPAQGAGPEESEEKEPEEQEPAQGAGEATEISEPAHSAGSEPVQSESQAKTVTPAEKTAEKSAEISEPSRSAGPEAAEISEPLRSAGSSEPLRSAGSSEPAHSAGSEHLVFAEIVPPAQTTSGEVVAPVTFRPRKPPVSKPASTPKETFSAQRAQIPVQTPAQVPQTPAQVPQTPAQAPQTPAQAPVQAPVQTPAQAPVQTPQEIRAKETKNPEPKPVQRTGSEAAKAKYTDIASLASSGRRTDIEQAIEKAKH